MVAICWREFWWVCSQGPSASFLGLLLCFTSCTSKTQANQVGQPRSSGPALPVFPEDVSGMELHCGRCWRQDVGRSEFKSRLAVGISDSMDICVVFISNIVCFFFWINLNIRMFLTLLLQIPKYSIVCFLFHISPFLFVSLLGFLLGYFSQFNLDVELNYFQPVSFLRINI